MLARAVSIPAGVQNWLAQFERALAEPDDAPLRALFHSDSYWRDLLALTWQIRTVNCADAILRDLREHARRAGVTGFRIDPDRTPPRAVTRAGIRAIEAIFKFETGQGRGSGVLRLIADAGDGDKLKAWTLLTALDELKGFEETVGGARPDGIAYSRDFRGPNWLDQRKAAAEYAAHDRRIRVDRQVRSLLQERAERTDARVADGVAEGAGLAPGISAPMARAMLSRSAAATTTAATAMRTPLSPGSSIRGAPGRVPRSTLTLGPLLGHEAAAVRRRSRFGCEHESAVDRG